MKINSITISKESMVKLAPAMAIIGILIGKHQTGPLLLFLIGITLGIFIHKGFK